MKPHQILRAASQADHEIVDGAFGRFRLADRSSYAAFLTAHARALPAVEARLADVPALPAWRPRTPALAADLAALGQALPDPLDFDPAADDAAAWGMLYVIEGSRLGGGMLARSVGGDLPRAYLSATHLPGEWRDFLAGFDTAAADGGEAWLDRAKAAANRTFALYQRAAAIA